VNKPVDGMFTIAPSQCFDYICCMRILFADSAHPSLKQKLQVHGFQCDEPDLARDAIKSILHQYDAVVIRSRFKFDREMLDAAAGSVRCIARVGAGMENIDVTYAESLGIKCLSAPEGNRDAVAEHALAMLLALMNNLCRADREVRQGLWIREGNRGYELNGKTVGIIGLGNNGAAFARVLAGFNCRVLAHDPYIEPLANHPAQLVKMETLFSECDVVSLHIPLNEETLYLANADWFNRFAKPIWFVNTARGKCLRTAELIQAIESGKVLGAALDVLEFESVSFENADTAPAEFQWLSKSDKVVLSPHIAGWTHESNVKMASILSERICEVLKP
jgi:D-3-phosphoglycerate dehydrogenase